MGLRIIPVFAFAACLMSGCGGDKLPNGGFSVDNLRLVEAHDGTRNVSGVVRNQNPTVRSVQVEIALYDAHNQPVGELQIPINSIPAEGIKGFEWSLDREAEAVRLKRIYH